MWKKFHRSMFTRSSSKSTRHFSFLSSILASRSSNTIRHSADRNRFSWRIRFGCRYTRFDEVCEFEVKSLRNHLNSFRILAQTSAKIVKPKETRPNQGQLRMILRNSHSMMFCFETGRFNFERWSTKNENSTRFSFSIDKHHGQRWWVDIYSKIFEIQDV